MPEEETSRSRHHGKYTGHGEEHEADKEAITETTNFNAPHKYIGEEEEREGPQ